MIEYRHFLNTDPPFIVDIWRSQKPFRGLADSLTRNQLDQLVLSKPYFDRDGLILAFEGSTPLGFVHAGFAPNRSLDDLDLSVGIICQLRVVPGEKSIEVGQGLLNAGCRYLESRGARECHAASRFPHAPFYLGLYGGSRIPGLLSDDESAINAFTQFGFVAGERVAVMQKALAGFRTIVDRRQMSVRRQYQIAAVVDPIERSWWESCTLGLAERVSFKIVQRNDQVALGSVSFWEIEPLATSWGVSAMGMYDLQVDEELRGCGLATFLVSESLRQLAQQGVGLVEAQARATDKPALGSFQRLGFNEIAWGQTMRLAL